MLTPLRPEQWRQALAVPHRVAVKVEVWDGNLDELLIADLPFEAGSVEATLQSRVARRLRLSLAAEWGTHDDLEPWGNHLVAYRGIDWGGGEVELFTVFVGRIQSLTVGDRCEVEALDRASDVVDAGFMRPYLVGSRRLHAELKALISDAVPGAAYDTFTAPDITVPTLMYETDRAEALDSIASAGGGIWYPLADGVFTLRRLPWEVPGDPVMTVADGPGGVLADASYRLDRAQVFNAVRAVGERTDGGVPMEHVVYDVRPESPFYYKGNFGFRPKVVQAQAAADSGLVRLVAESTLRRHQSTGETWSWSQPGDPTVELGDVVRLVATTLQRDVHQVVLGFSLPLSAGPMTVNGRSHTHGELTEVD